MAYLKCSCCGTFVDEQYQSCPQCGKRLYDHTQKKKSGGAVIVWLVVFVFLAAVGFFGMRAYKAYQEQAYEEKLRNAVYEITMSAVEAEEAGNLLHAVWYNSIFEIEDPETDKYTRKSKGTGPFYTDFNNALLALSVDADYSATLEGIEESRSDLAQLMRELSDPPEKYRTDYEDLRKLYSAYYRLSAIVIDQNGSLQSFTDDFNAADTSLADCLYPLTIYLNG